jgi:hypothetical protein
LIGVIQAVAAVEIDRMRGVQGLRRRWPLAAQALLASAIIGFADAGHAAIVACTASDVIANESGCPNSATAPCEITKDYDVVQSACTFDFGSRAVTIKGTSLIDAGSKKLTLRAGSLLVKKFAEIRAKGDAASSAGGTIQLGITGSVNLETQADVTVSSSSMAGTIGWGRRDHSLRAPERRRQQFHRQGGHDPGEDDGLHLRRFHR